MVTKNSAKHNVKVVDNNGNVLTVAAAGVVKAADAQVKATAGIIHAISVSFVGVTIGDKIEVKNSADNSGTALITLVATAANQTIQLPGDTGVIFDVGIYYDVTLSGGTATASIVFS